MPWKRDLRGTGLARTVKQGLTLFCQGDRMSERIRYDLRGRPVKRRSARRREAGLSLSGLSVPRLPFPKLYLPMSSLPGLSATLPSAAMPRRLWIPAAGLGLLLVGGVAATAADRDAGGVIAAPAQPLHTYVQDEPAIDMRANTAFDGLRHVEASQTPSGFEVPRFVSLKFGRVNARTGPSRDHSIAYQYRRRGLPLIVVAETEMWRKVRDMDGDEAWVRKPALSGERRALLSGDAVLHSRASGASGIVARLQTGTLVDVEGCETPGFCEVRTSAGIKGHVRRSALWGDT